MTLEHQKRGKKGKASGLDFEKRTRAYLVEKGWIVSKFPNKVEFTIEHQGTPGMTSIQTEPDEVVVGKLSPSKHKFRGPGLPMAMGTGFPDFIAYKQVIPWNEVSVYQIIFVESKVGGYLRTEEKEMARWYLDNKYCEKFYISYKTKEKGRIKVNLRDFEDIK